MPPPCGAGSRAYVAEFAPRSGKMRRMSSLELGIIGNSSVSALVDRRRRDLLGLHAARGRAIPCSARCCASAATRTISASLPSTWTAWRAPSRSTCRTPPVLVTRLYDGNGGARRDHRFRAALPPVRAPVLPEPAGAHGAARSRAARASASGCARRATTAASGARSPGAPTTCAISRADYAVRLTTDCSITAILEESSFVLREPLRAGARPGRDAAGLGGGRGAALPRADRRLLARLGARPVDPVRVAGGDHPRRDHAQAGRLRRHRRDRRRADHLDSRRPPAAAATGTTATAGCATPISSSTRSTG